MEKATWTGWSCVSGPAELVDFLVDRGEEVSYSTFRKNVDLKTADFLEPWQRRLLKGDYSVTFLKTELPDGSPAWVLQYSGIEYAFVQPGVDFDQAIEDVEILYKALEDEYNNARDWPRAVIDATLREKNPLDPYAYDTEPRPFHAPGRIALREDHIGVHTTGSLERAAVYAVNRVELAHGDTVGIVFVLDMEDLDPLPDVDAQIESETRQDVGDAIYDYDGIREAVEAGDEDTLEELIQEFIENGSMFEAEGDILRTTWLASAYATLDEKDVYRVGLVLGELPPDELMEILKTWQLPLTFWASVIQQQRYLTPVGLDRVLKVLALRPIRQDLWGHGPDDPSRHEQEYPLDTPDKPQIFTDEDFFEDNWLPDMVTLYNSGRKVEYPEYHGTDLIRARKAFPELDLQDPWK